MYCYVTLILNVVGVDVAMWVVILYVNIKLRIKLLSIIYVPSFSIMYDLESKKYLFQKVKRNYFIEGH